MEVSLELARFNRRIVDEAYTAIDTEFQRRAVEGEPIEGFGGEIGREAAQRCCTSFGVTDPQQAIEADTSSK